MTFIPQEPFSIELSNDPNKAAFYVSGNARDLSSSVVPADLWQAHDAGNSPGTLSTYPFSTVAGLWSLSSNDAGAAQTIRVLSLKDDYQIDVEDVVLDGNNAVNLTGDTIRVLAMKNISGTPLADKVFILEGDAVFASGNPTMPIKIRGIIDTSVPTEVMQQAITTIPAGFKAYLTDSIVGIGRDSQAGGADRSMEAHLAAAPLGEVFKASARFELHNKGGLAVAPAIPWREIGEKVDIKIVIDNVTSNSAGISGNMSFVFTSDNAADIAILKGY